MLLIKLAFRNILRQRRRSLLTSLSMVGGYMLFVFSTSLLEGSWGNAVDIFTLDNTGHIQVHQDDYLKHPKIYKTIRDRAVVESALMENDEITGYTPRVFSTALAYATDKTAPARIIGVDPLLEPTVSRLAQKVSAGRYFNSEANDNGLYSAMIGQGLANSLKIVIGNEIVLISSGADGSIANDIYQVSAIIGNKTSFDRTAVYLPLTAAQEFLSLGNDVHEYAMLVDDDSENIAIAADLASKLPGATISPWQEVEATFYRTMQSDKQGNQFVLGLIIFIVFIGVLNTVLMSVLERTREFGVLRAIGCRPFELIRMVFIETMMLATLSVAAGLILAVPLVLWFNQVGFLLPQPIDVGGIQFDHVKGELSSFVFLMPMAFILITAAAISIPPGIRAARILPRDALGSH